jgi:DNA-binding Xre family transcriptional regulator
VISVKLREAMSVYSEKHGEKLTYQQLAERTGISKATLEAIGSRADYNTTLSVLNCLCAHLDCTTNELLEYHKD